MFQTQFGVFNGRSWEDLCQQVFKAKYGADGYVSIPASPGDYGIEGYTAHTGLAFQCYCPEKHFNTAQLYESQRDKVTEDLGKLFKNADPRLQPQANPMPFDGKRLIFGGFEVIVDA